MSAVDVLGRTPAPASRVALVTSDAVWTYGDLARATDDRARELHEEGAVSGALVPRVVDADVAGVVTLLALWRIGAIPAPLNARLTGPEIERARRVLGSVDTAPPGGSAAALRDVRDAQAVLWTSGTAGTPRGVVIPFEAIDASTRGAAERLELHADDVWLASLSPAHVGGLVLIARAMLLGCALVVSGSFDAAVASAWIDGRERGAVTHASLVPTQLLRLLDVRDGAPPPSTFRCALIGGAAAPSSLVRRALEAGWPLALSYGLTETTSQVATAPPGLVRGKPGTVGAPLAGVELRVADDGEILVRGATVASGYITADAEGRDRREEALRPLADPDGWHHTGDYGHVDTDGHLWVTGRRGDRIVSGGVTVDAGEVEEALRAHPSVRDAGVVGVPDEEWGERVGAWVELSDPAGAAATGAAGATGSEGGAAAGATPLDPVVLDAWLRPRLAAAKLPRVWLVGPALPRNANGKLDRAAVRDALTARGAAARVGRKRTSGEP